MKLIERFIGSQGMFYTLRENKDRKSYAPTHINYMIQK